MKGILYPKLAFEGIRKNRRLYLPYILTCVGMVMMYYIILYLQYCEPVHHLFGSDLIIEVVSLGSWVIAIFSCIFLFYTNSFLIRRRKKEFGLYNILGMGKFNLSLIQFWETLIVGVISLWVGLLAGILFSKLAELLLVNMVLGEIEYSMHISGASIVKTVIVFGTIFTLILLDSVRQIRFSTAISLLRAENAGEKPPKANWLLGVLGIALLIGAYYIAVVTVNPIAALLLFFIAVVMVILGTYLLMICGSVMFCRLLQKEKGYYYRPNHFVSVSSMVYRMKRNGAGLASICILATMVLVMISSTASLYFGCEDAFATRYPRDIGISALMNGVDSMTDSNIAVLKTAFDEFNSENGVVPRDIISYRESDIAGYTKNGVVEVNVGNFNINNASLVDDGLVQYHFIPIEDYNRIYGTDYTLSDGEALVYTIHGVSVGNNISFNGGRSFSIAGNIGEFVPDGDVMMGMVPTVFMFVQDLGRAVEGLDRLADYNGDQMLTSKWIYCYNTGLDPEDQIVYGKDVCDYYLGFDIDSGKFADCGLRYRSLEVREQDHRDFYALYGGLFFLGIMLSVVFIFAAVLIIYYKQVSEGYEDQSRFEIMQKVGMTKPEIRRSINSQLLTVFFLPLVLAALHLGFAFPIIKRLLSLFNLANTYIFLPVTLGCFAVFAILYTVVYRITSNAYYNIVSGVKEG